MSNGPPSRDRRSLQDLAKLASSSNLGGLSKTPPPAAVTVTEAVHDSGIVDLKQIAKADEGAEVRSKTTPLASSPLFDEETPAIPGPSSRPSSAPKAGGESAPASSPRAVGSAPSAPASQPRASAAAAAGASPTPAGSKMPIVLGVGVLAVVALVAAFARSPKTEPTVPPATQAVATAATGAPAATTATPPANQPAAAETAVASAAAPEDPASAAAGTPDNGKGATANAGGGGRKQPPAGAKVVPGAGGSTVSPLAAMMAQSTGATTAPGAPVPTAAPGALGEAVEHAVGPGAVAPAAEAPAAAAPQYAAGTVPDKPSQGAVTGALGRVLPAARSCLNPDDPISKANVTFASTGLVSAVTVTGSAAGKPAEHCIKSALIKTSVPPFVQDSYSATVTVRPN